MYRDNKARSLLTIMILIAIAAFLLKIAIEQLIQINVSYNESNASATLKLISVALENYAKDHLGYFPENISALIQDTPPYLDKDYLMKSPLKGYNYNCLRLEPSGYNCSAQPARCGMSGRMAYTVTTGGLFLAEPCRRKE